MIGLRKFAAFVVGGCTLGGRPIGSLTDDVIELFFAALQRDASSAARGGSWLLEAGWPLHHAQHMLRHANISQTSRT
jgi:hypothetical protein